MAIRNIVLVHGAFVDEIRGRPKASQRLLASASSIAWKTCAARA